MKERDCEVELAEMETRRGDGVSSAVKVGNVPQIKAMSKRSRAMTALTVIGVVMGLGGATHGPGEILQGSVETSGLVIEAWPSLTALAGEPAMSFIPNYLVMGVLATISGVAVAVWAATRLDRRYGGLVLIQLSLLMLLFGGGIIPPLVAIEVGLLAMWVKGKEGAA